MPFPQLFLYPLLSASPPYPRFVEHFRQVLQPEDSVADSGSGVPFRPLCCSVADQDEHRPELLSPTQKKMKRTVLDEEGAFYIAYYPAEQHG